MLHIENDTTKFLNAIESTIKRGPINTEGYYSFASFKYRSYTYIITPNDAFLTRVHKFPASGELITCVAPHKHNKDGLRDRYTFNTNYLLFDVKQITVDVARLNAALLIPDAFEKLISNDGYEVNHKAILNNTYRSQIYKTSLKALAMYRKLRRTADSKTGILLDHKTASSKVYDEYKDVCFDVCIATDDLRKSPVLLRDNRVSNLEVCTGLENKAHFRAVREFTSLATGSDYDFRADASLKPIEAEKAAAYDEGKMTRQDFILYMLSLKDIEPREAEIANFNAKPSEHVEALLTQGTIRELLSL